MAAPGHAGSAPAASVRSTSVRLTRRLDAVVQDVLADHRPPASVLNVGPWPGAAQLRRRSTAVTVVPELPDAGLPCGDGQFGLVVCVDLLSRLPHPDAALRELARTSAGHLLLCVPHEPFARARTQLTGRLGRDAQKVADLQHWTGAGFQRFVSQVAAVRQVASPWPWTVIWAVKGGPSRAHRVRVAS